MRNNLWKKISVIGVFCVMIFSSFLFVSCDGENYSKADVDNVYSSIVDDYCDARGYIDIQINASKVVQADVLSEDKYYIFPYVLDNYVNYASGLVFSVAKRQNGIMFSLINFSQKQLNDIYSKFSNVLSCLKSIDEVKTIYENSDGYLRYHDLINSYYNLIDKLYSLNDSFSEYYFAPLYSSNFTSSNLTKAVLSDIFWFELHSLSKVSYVYDLKNYLVDESEGYVTTWYNNSTILESFMSDTSELLSTLLLNNDLTLGITTINKSAVAQIINNMLEYKNTFKRDYNNFILATEGSFFKNYIYSTNKTSYIESCSTFEKSKINLINTFILGRYEGFMGGIRLAITNMNV